MIDSWIDWSLCSLTLQSLIRAEGRNVRKKEIPLRFHKSNGSISRIQVDVCEEKTATVRHQVEV